MLAALKESQEPRHIVYEATKYLQGVKGTLAQAKRIKAQKAADAVAARSSYPDYPPGVHPFGSTMTSATHGPYYPVSMPVYRPGSAMDQLVPRSGFQAPFQNGQTHHSQPRVPVPAQSSPAAPPNGTGR